MSFDIYGNDLKYGYCEAHPNTNEPFPCSECFREQEQSRHQEAYYKAQEEAQTEAYNKTHADKLCEEEIPF